MTVRRDPLLAGLIGLVFLGTMPAWDRVFEEPSWRAPALLAAVTALVLGATLRRLRAGPLVSLGVSLVALLSLTPWLVGATPRPMMPTPTAWDVVWAHIEQSVVDVEATRSPAPALPGLVTILVLGSWLMTHASHELLVRWRRPALAAVPLTGWWVIALAVPLPQGRGWPQTVPFMASLLLGLLVISNDDREPDEMRVRIPVPGLVAGTLAIMIAATGPGLLPGYQQEPWSELGGGGGNPRGYQPIVDISERLRLPEQRDVLRVEASQRTYLRLAGLDTFTGSSWRLGPDTDDTYRPDRGSLYSASDVLPPEEFAGRTEAVFVEVEVLDLANIYAPVPYQPVQVLGPARSEMVWSTEGGFLATLDTTEIELGEGDGRRVGVREGMTYSVQAARPTPTRDDLVGVRYDPEMLERWTQLPREYPALRDQAEAIYAAAGAEEVVDRVLALQEWFVGEDSEFTYDLDVAPLRGEDGLERFVLEDKTGYCEYFATAMAVMLRASGIPARVAIGFLPGELTRAPTPDRELAEFVVSTSDAHAWVEVLFPGAGWVTFEPTPRSDESQVVPTASDLAPVENQAERRQRELGSDDAGGGDASGLPIPQGDLEFDLDSLGDGQGAELPEGDGGGGRGAAAWYLTVVLVLVAGWALTLLTRLRRRFRWRHDGTPAGRILAAQRRLFDAASRYGIGRRPDETSVEVIERWRAERRIDRRGTRVAHAAQSAAFGGEVDDVLAHQTELLVRELEQMLRESVEPRERWLVPVRSQLATARSGGRRLAERLRDR